MTAHARKLAKKYKLLIWFPSMRWVILLYSAAAVLTALIIVFKSDLLYLDIYTFTFANFLLPVSLFLTSPIINMRRCTTPVEHLHLSALILLLLNLTSFPSNRRIRIHSLSDI